MPDNAAARVEAENIVALLQKGEYPYQLPILAGEQGYHLYPSIEVRETAQSRNRDPSVDTESTSFTCTLYVRYTRSAADEEADVAKIQKEVMRALDQAPLQKGAQIFMNARGWSRRVTREPYGVQAALNITVRLVSAWERDTAIGAGAVLEMAGQRLNLIGPHTSTQGRSADRSIDDSGNSSPNLGARTHSMFFEYKWTPLHYAAIRSLILDGDILDAWVQYPPTDLDGVPPVPERLRAMPVRQRKSVTYQGLQTCVLELEIEEYEEEA